ncbi:hypothetical protein [Halovenus marina]|uniref:hypothetical protein n=1 Tax=Halovenus marina TaxID=3396621 RepID=UPI003F54D8EB
MSKFDEGVFLFNPLPWDRDIAGPVPLHVLSPRGEDDDQTAGRHYQDRDPEQPSLPTHDGADRDSSLYGSSVLLEPTTVPGYGYTVASPDDLVSQSDISESEQGTIETHRYDVRFDRERGGIASLYDRDLEHEWVDDDAEYPVGSFVHEQVANDDWSQPRQRLFRWPADEWHDAAIGLGDNPRGFQADWHAQRRGPEQVRRHVVYDTPLGYDVRQELVVPQLESDVALRLFFPSYSDEVVVEARWQMGLTTHPESTYLAFPFSIDDAVPHLDVGGTAIQPGADQMPDSVHDYYTAQKWASLSNESHSMVVSCPLNPMIQFGEFGFANNDREFSLTSPQILGWVTNNYWDTNFRAHQPGPVTARYHLTPHDGPFDESFAHRRGSEAEVWRPLAQTLGEGTVSDPPLDARGQLLDLPAPPNLVLQIRPLEEQTGRSWPDYTVFDPSDEFDMLVLVHNASDTKQSTSIESEQLTIKNAEFRTPQGGSMDRDLQSQGGRVDLKLAPRKTIAVALDCTQ